MVGFCRPLGIGIFTLTVAARGADPDLCVDCEILQAIMATRAIELRRSRDADNSRAARAKEL